VHVYYESQMLKVTVGGGIRLDGER